MSPITFVAPYYYNTVWYFALLLFTWAIVIYYIGSGEQKLLRSEGTDASQAFAVLLTFVVIYYIGLRPIHADFVDMKMYAESYRRFAPSMTFQWPSLRKEWLWVDLFVFFNHNGFTVYSFFLFVEFIYVIGMLICAVIVTRNNLLMTMMFMITSFSFLSFGENGIRNGLACSLLMVGICLLPSEKKSNKIWALLLMYLAMGIHRSSMLPIVASLSSLYLIKDTKTALRFWVASVGISLVAGPLMEQFFTALGFDDRMEQYTRTDQATMESTFSRTGFRWDFMLYSAFPVVMIWYVTIHRKFRDKAYNVLAITYLLCNAFWLMVIRAAFSNRFAYLSWFIYPLVIAYPLLRMNLWKDQDRRTAILLFFYSGFEFFMFFIYYFGTTGFKGFQLYWWRK
jgi:hypothetical protein